MRLELGPGLDALKAAATLEVDRQAEACRLQFITPGAGQALEYSGGEQEALALLALLQGGGTPDPANYPFVVAEQEAQAEALGTAPELADIALEVATQSGQWRFVGALIKKLRRGAKLKIELATTAAEVRAAATVTWPSA